MNKLFSMGTLKTILNLAGTGLVVAGVWMLPIDISFRLIILGVMSLIMWYTLQ